MLNFEFLWLMQLLSQAVQQRPGPRRRATGNSKPEPAGIDQPCKCLHMCRAHADRLAACISTRPSLNFALDGADEFPSRVLSEWQLVVWHCVYSPGPPLSGRATSGQL